MENQVKFSYGLLANYNGLATKDAHTVYFITDAPYIFFNGVKYGVQNSDIAAVSGVALGADNKTLTISYANGTEATTIVLAEATQSVAGLMSAADKTKLDNLKDQAELGSELEGINEAIAAAQKTADDHIADADVHITAEERTKLGDIDASLVGVSASELPVSTATQAELDKKVDKVEGSSLVADTEIAKLAALKSQADITADITAAQEAVQSNLDAEIAARKAADKAITGFEETYAANASANYISDATSLNDADVKLDAKIKEVIDDLATLTGTGEGTIADQISAAVTESEEKLQGNIDAIDEAYKAADATLTQGVADNKSAIEAVEGDLSDLDAAVAEFKNKSVGTSIAAPGSDEVLPTTKAVVDYVAEVTGGVANNMTYTAKEGDDSVMELKLISVDGDVLSTIELDKENFLSSFVKRAATAEDAAADSSIAEGDPILVVTMSNGDLFRVNLKSLVDVYSGVANKAITTSVDGYVVKAQLNIDSAANTASAVKLTEGDNGLSAALAIDSTKNGANGIELAQDGNGLSASLKIDADTNTANGTAVTVGAEGMSVAILWTEL